MSGHHNLPSRKTRTPVQIKARDARDRVQRHTMRDGPTRRLYQRWLAGTPPDWTRGQSWTELQLAVFGDNPQFVLDVGGIYLGVQIRAWLREQLATRGGGGGAMTEELTPKKVREWLKAHSLTICTPSSHALCREYLRLKEENERQRQEAEALGMEHGEVVKVALETLRAWAAKREASRWQRRGCEHFGFSELIYRIGDGTAAKDIVAALAKRAGETP